MNFEEKIIFYRTAKIRLICLLKQTVWNRNTQMYTKIRFWAEYLAAEVEVCRIIQQINKELLGCLNFEAILYEE